MPFNESLLLTQWIARLGTHQAVQKKLFSDALLFALWYNTAGEFLDWPESAELILERHREKKLTFERAAHLLTNLEKTYHTQVDMAQAQGLLEGFTLHEWVVENFSDFKDLLDAHAKRIAAVKGVTSELGAPSDNLATFFDCLSLSQTEKMVLALSVYTSSSPIFKTLLQAMTSSDDKALHTGVWCHMLDCTRHELSRALSAQSPLRKSGLLQSPKAGESLPGVSPFWVQVLRNPLESLFDQLLEPLEEKAGSGIPARLADVDRDLAVNLLKNAKAEGVNLLLYGEAGMERSYAVSQILRMAMKKGYVVRSTIDSWEDIASAAYVAQRLLKHEHGDNAVLVIEKPADVLHKKPSQVLQALFGLDVDRGYVPPFDELMLETNPIPTVWAGPGSEQLSEDSVSRFVFHAPLQKARRQDRRQQLEMYVQNIAMSKATREALLKLEQVSARQISSALRAAELMGPTSKKEKEVMMLQAVKRSLQALKRDTSADAKECVTGYSLKYLNHSGRFGPEQILKALQIRPKGSLCLYGPPGTGKTQFVDYLAQNLGLRVISRKASDLLSKWVGDNEKNVAQMFKDAEAEEALLFLDEADSFLRDRSHAKAGWEVSQVNELLQHMERFEGIFVVATNFFEGLDAAALRRFTFKMEFLPLDPDQRWDLFVQEAELKGKLKDYSRSEVEEWKEALWLMPQLCAGDFATVKRQCVLLGETLTPPQWIEQLTLECKVKKKDNSNQPQLY